MSGITAMAGATGSLYQAPQNPRRVEHSPAEEQAESTVKRTAEALATAAGVASKAASSAHSHVDTYA